MNIFFLAQSPAAAAALHCDKHVVKMILETVQMLYTYIDAMNVALPPGLDRDGRALVPYKSTHRHHPCVLWLHGGRSHVAWLLALGLSLCHQYTQRYAKKHASEAHLAHMHRCVDARMLPKDCGTATEWLQRLADQGVKADVLRACAAKVSTTNPPEGCAFGVACMADDTVPLECDADGQVDLVATYHSYYAFKNDHMFTMKWAKTSAPPQALGEAFGTS